jgi:6,7-dimethyl-8-ribityllumazine synthase
MNQPTPRSTAIAVISASWHAEIVGQASTAIDAELKRSDSSVQVEHLSVPGAYEIPLHVQLLAKSGRFDAIIACGLVVDGGIYRHDFVARAVIDGLMRVQLDTEVPVFSVVLTPHHFHEHDEHQRYFREHFVKKGIEVAQACQATLSSLRAITG